MGGKATRKWVGLTAVIASMAGATWWGIHGGWAGHRDRRDRGSVAYRRGDWEAAEARARAILKADPSDREALRLLARAAARRGRDESAEAIYRRLGTGSMEAEDYYLLGRGLLARGQLGPGLASLGAARDVQPDHAETLDALSRYWSENRMLTEAAEAAERLARQPGWEVRGGVRLGRLRADLLDPAGAAAVLSDALRRDPKLDGADLEPAAAVRLLVRCWLRTGRPAEARALLQDDAGRGLDPEGAWLLSRAWLQEGKLTEAASALTAARGFADSDPLAPEPAPYLGAESCASCHPKEFRSQQGSRHSRTLRRTAELGDLPWPDRNIPEADNPRVVHRFDRAGTRFEVVTRVDAQVFRAVVEYALGSNHQGRSFLARQEDGQVRELRLSQYPDAPKWGRTMEHPAVPPDEPGYLGRPISAEAFRKCLNCHATNHRAAREPDGRPEARDHGIGCERCHGPGGHHRPAIEAGLSEPAIARPRLAAPARVVALCADCHTAPAKTTPADAGFVRYQASGFVLSRCYTESAQDFSCTTCHNPHQNAETLSNFYESRCLKCHSPSPSAGPRRSGKPCPINPRSDCLTCHMPRVRDAIPRTVFTDHWIRIHRP
jgi:tetratricopeptide (TPR) repeat protein